MYLRPSIMPEIYAMRWRSTYPQFSSVIFFKKKKTFYQQPIKISASFYWHSGTIRSHAQQECSFVAKFQEAVCETNLCERVQILMRTFFTEFFFRLHCFRLLQIILRCFLRVP
jgi:hypothetical protein